MSELQALSAPGTQQTGTVVASWYKVPYLTANHFVEVYQNVTYFTSISNDRPKRTHYKRKKDDIKSISPKSRVRALQLLNMIDPSSLHTPHFVTLTYHSRYPTTAAAIKTDLDKFLKRLRRCYSTCYYFWRVELQRRGAPHFHLILWFPRSGPDRDRVEILRSVRDLWIHHIDCGCRDCHAHAVRVDPVTSPKQAAYYVSKYLAKTEEFAAKIGLGRLWGSSRNLPIVQQGLFYGATDFITCLQFASILFSIQYTLSNPDYLISLLCRPSAFLFIPSEVVLMLQFAINEGCSDPVAYAAARLSYDKKRAIIPVSLPPAPGANRAASLAQLAPPRSENLPVVSSDFVFRCQQQLNHYSNGRINLRKFTVSGL